MGALFLVLRNGAELDSDEDRLIASLAMTKLTLNKPDFCNSPIARGLIWKKKMMLWLPKRRAAESGSNVEYL